MFDYRKITKIKLTNQIPVIVMIKIVFCTQHVRGHYSSVRPNASPKYTPNQATV